MTSEAGFSIGWIGIRLPITGVSLIGPDSTRSLLDHDVLVVDIEPWARVKANSAAGNPRFADQITALAGRIAEFIQHGRPIVFLATGFPLRGRSAAKALFGINSNWEETVGTSIRVVQGRHPPFASFLTAIREHLSYRAACSLTAECVATIGAAEKSICDVHWTEYRSWIFLIPRVNFEMGGCTSDLFVSSLRALVLATAPSAEGSTDPLPAWHQTYALPGERENRAKVRTLQSQRERLDREIAEAELLLTDTVAFKRAMSDAHGGLVLAVKALLEKLGFMVEHGPPMLVDLVASFEGRPLVVEVKGKERGSAAEKDVMQLERWRIDYADANDGHIPKGLLIINAFRELPIKDRVEEAFPAQVARRLQGRDHVAMTSVQLLCLAFSCANDDDRRAAVNSMYETSGVYGRFAGHAWSEVITLDNGPSTATS